MINDKISLNTIEESIHIGYVNDKQGEVALKAKQEILQSFSGINELLEEFYDRLLRDDQFKKYVEGNLKKAINNPILNKNRDFMELDESDLKLSANLYLSGFYKDSRKVFNFEKNDNNDDNGSQSNFPSFPPISLN